MDSIHLAVQSATLPLVGMWYVAPLFRSRLRGMYVRFTLVFLAFFLLNMFFLMERYNLFESILRSTGVGVMPLVVGYLWARYGWPHSRDK
jgi:hypothetical protein